MLAQEFRWTRTLSRLESSSQGGVSRPVHLLTELAEKEGDTILTLKLTDSSKVWEGSIGSKSMAEYGLKHNIDNLEEYLSVTHGALTGKTTHPPTEAGEGVESLEPWEFELKTDDVDVSKVSFVWKKSISSGIKVHFGAIELYRQEGGVGELLDEIITELKRRDEEVLKFKEVEQECVTQRAAALKLVEKAVEGKEEYEREVMSSFCLALNKKKEKIRCLQEELKLISRIRSGVDLRDSGSDTEAEGNEDQETLVKGNSENANDSDKKSGLLKTRLNLERDEDDVTGPPLKKRTRVSKRISKDVPKDSKPSSRQKPRVASRKGRTSLDADDLIEDM